MKKLILICLAISLSTTIQAQSEDEELAFAQSLWGKEKKQIVSDFLALEGDAATTFWTIYEDYEVERKAIAQERYALITEYVATYAGITDESADEMMKTSFSIRKKTIALWENYSQKISKSNGGKVAAQFIQLESHFANAFNLTLSGGLPFVGEADSIDE